MMKSVIVQYLKPEFEPVAVVFSDSIPDNTLQFEKGKFGCVLNLFAEASRRGRIAGGSRETISCPGGRAALGLDHEGLTSDIDFCATIFSKGLASAPDQAAYRKRMEAARESWQPLYQYGERRHSSFELAMKWLQNDMPRYQVPARYVLFKPLGETEPEDDVRVVIFPVNPVELAGLSTLLGSVVEGRDPIMVPPGADCFRIAGYPYPRSDAGPPRAVLGMLDIDGREVMRKRFSDGILTLAIPIHLFELMEQEAEDSVLRIPGWQALRSK
jgi:uncharacterized protein (DUF169 family)